MRIAIVEDHRMMLDFLRKACAKIPGIEVVAEASTGSEAYDQLVQRRPDGVILDVGLPDADGIELLGRVRDAGVRPRALILSASSDPYFFFRVERAGVQAFVDKRSQTAAELRTALIAMDGNHCYFSESFTSARAHRRRDPVSFDKILTEQQLMVMCLVAECQDDDQIAGRLEISSRTVEAHRTAIMHKLNIHSRTGLIAYGQSRGFKAGHAPFPPRGRAAQPPSLGA